MDVHQLDQYGGIGPLHTLEADLVDAAQSVCARNDLPLAQSLVLGLRQAVAAQLVGLAARGRLPDPDGLAHALERSRADGAQLGLDQHVALAEARELLVDALLPQEVDELPDDAERRGDLVALEWGRGDVH